MKQVMLVASMFAVCVTAQAQKGIPVAVKSAFEKAYPKATAVKWDKERNGDFEANCTNNNVAMSLTYDAKGALLETETEIMLAEFPVKVTDAIYAKYPTVKITGGDKIVTNKGVTKYEADLTIGQKKIEKLFDAEGNLIN